MKKIPTFKTDEDAARFWESHRFQDYYRDTMESGIKFVRRAKRTVAVRLDPDDIKSVEKIAERKGLSYTSLLRCGLKNIWTKKNGLGKMPEPVGAGER
jgi:predicted DNA binding CopG/RHH family protein